MVAAKQEKAYERIKNFRTELTDYREQFNRIKAENDERVRFPQHHHLPCPATPH